MPKRAIAVSLALVGVAAIAVVALRWGGAGGGPEEAPRALPDVVLFNWKDYTDPGLLEEFERESGIHVVLREYETTDMALARLQTEPGAYDVFISDSELGQLLMDTRLATPFDRDRLGNLRLVRAPLPGLEGPGIPYLWGTTGLAVNRARVTERPVRWSMLWDPRHRDRVLLLDDMRDVTEAILLAAGRSINDRTPAAMRELLDRGLALRENGVEYGETFDNFRRLLGGEKWIVQAYSGDFLLSTGDSHDFDFALPEEGFVLWLDCLFLSATARNPEGAYRLVDFLLRPENSARSATEMRYASPVRGAERFLDPALLADPIIHPPPAVLGRAQHAAPSDESTRELSRIFGLIRSRP